MEWIDFHVYKVNKAQPQRDGVAMNNGTNYVYLIKRGSCNRKKLLEVDLRIVVFALYPQLNIASRGLTTILLFISVPAAFRVALLAKR